MTTTVLERPIEVAVSEIPTEFSPYRKLAQAIRRGCQMAPQAFNASYRGGATCALGAAVMGIGWRPLVEDGYLIDWERPGERLFLMKELGFEEYEGPIVSIPTSGRQTSLSQAIVCLNDDYHWSRERIADWVEGLEVAE